MEQALTALLLGCIGALAALVEYIRRELAKNTELTQQTKTAANTTLQDSLARQASQSNLILALREIVREREDRLAYIVARHPEVEETLGQYRERRSKRITEAEEIAAERAILRTEESTAESL